MVVRAWVESQREPDVVLHIAVADTGVGIPADKIEMVFRGLYPGGWLFDPALRGGGIGAGDLLGTGADDGRLHLGGKRAGSRKHLPRYRALGFGRRTRLPPADEAASDLLRGVPVLVVDDHAASREILADMLRHRGMIPTVVDGAEAALAAIREAQNSASPFRLALFDAQMPGGDGFALAEQARRDPGIPGPHPDDASSHGYRARRRPLPRVGHCGLLHQAGPGIRPGQGHGQGAGNVGGRRDAPAARFVAPRRNSAARCGSCWQRAMRSARCW